MPRVPVDYSKTIIYRISHKEIAGLDYVGSTTDYTRRKAYHKTQCNSPNSKHHHLKVYQIIRDNGGWDSFQMLEVKKYPCNDNREAEAEEEQCRQQLKAKLNTRRAFVTDAERKEYGKRYVEEHKDQIADRMKQYHLDNKEKMNEKSRQYCQKNKDQIKQKASMKYTCELCQCSSLIIQKGRHEKTRKHQSNLVLAVGSL